MASKDAPVAPLVEAKGGPAAPSAPASAFQGNTLYILSAMILVAVGAFVVAYVLYWLINKFLFMKKSHLVTETKVPIVGTQYSKFPSTDIPLAGNGQRLSISFWIYIHDITKFAGTPRHVFHRGDQNNTGASPYVFLDATENKLYVYFSPKAGNGTLTPGTKEFAEHYGIKFDYIPLQRWVHVAVVVNENANGGTMTGYVDGEIITSRTDAKLSGLMLDKTGDIWVGGSVTEQVGPGFSGLVSKIKFYNHDLNVADVYKDYMSGPIDNLLSKLGLPVYGVRSPIYRIG